MAGNELARTRPLPDPIKRIRRVTMRHRRNCRLAGRAFVCFPTKDPLGLGRLTRFGDIAVIGVAGHASAASNDGTVYTFDPPDVNQNAMQDPCEQNSTCDADGEPGDRRINAGRPNRIRLTNRATGS